MSLKHLYIAAVAVVIGCAPASSTTGDSQVPAVRPEPSLITAYEIASRHAETWTAFDVIARLRPNWFAAHGMSTFDSRSGSEFATVFIDGQWMRGGFQVLRNIPANQVKDFRFYDVTLAGATFGLQAGQGGAIELRLK